MWAGKCVQDEGRKQKHHQTNSHAGRAERGQGPSCDVPVCDASGQTAADQQDT